MAFEDRPRGSESRLPRDNDPVYERGYKGGEDFRIQEPRLSKDHVERQGNQIRIESKGPG